MFGPQARLDYAEEILRFMDRYVRGIDNGVERRASRARVRDGRERLAVGGHAAAAGHAAALALSSRRAAGSPARRPPAGGDARDGVRVGPGASRAQRLRGKGRRPRLPRPRREAGRRGLRDRASGRAAARRGHRSRREIFLSADAPDADLWVKLEDVAPDGTAWNLSSPGTDVLRVYARDGGAGRSRSRPGEIAVLRLPNLRTGNLFAKGHRVRIVLCGSFMPDFSRNLQTGESETRSAKTRKAAIRIHHDAAHASRIILPVVGSALKE